MFSDRVPRSVRLLAGEPLTLLLIAVSILGGIGLAIACSYPLAVRARCRGWDRVRGHRHQDQ